ncbi:hypothetical protein ACIFOC_01371 [Leucobacter aridicollis]|uniref:fibronectin type III domain-containing protein n=1 Tax=Leucobacter aridicollis TaxID=283878 RepID=UPI0037CA8815
MPRSIRFGGLVAAALAASTFTIAPGAAQAVQDPLPDGKAEGSGEYGLIGDSLETVPNIYGVAIDDAGSIWYAVTDGASRGITEYRPGTLDPNAGDYLGNGEYAEGTGYLGAGWEDPVRYTHRDSSREDPAGGTQPWAEPRGVEPLAGGGLAVSDTNGNVSTPVGTVLFYDADHAITGNAGVGGDQGCTQLAQGELAWGPYFAVLGDKLYAPYEGCNVVSVFAVPDGEPLHQLTGEGQTAGASPNPAVTNGPGGLSDIYGVSSDGAAIYTSDLGYNRTPGAGLVQRWTLTDDGTDWQLDRTFADDGALSFPGVMMYNTVVGPANDLYAIPQSGPVQRFTNTGEYLADVQVRDVPYTSARDLAVTDEGWIVMTAKGEHSLRIIAESPSPVTGLTGETGPTAGSVELSWDAVEASYGQAPVLDYVVERSADGGATWEAVERVISLDTTATIAGLAPGAYDFRVTAYSEAGRGDAASVDAVVAADAAPEVATTLTGTAPEATELNAEVTWEATVTNPGNTPLDNVTAVFEAGTDGAAETVEIGALGVGASQQVSVAAPLTEAQLEDLTAANAVAVTGSAPDGTEVTASATAEVTLAEVTDPGTTGPGTDEPGPTGPGTSDGGADPATKPGTALAHSGSGAPIALTIGTMLVAAGAAWLLARKRHTVA